jgi:uridylate kinase
MLIKYKRILLKLSGEAFKGQPGVNQDYDKMNSMIDEIIKAKHAGTQIAIVVGGGNFFRGREAHYLDKVTTDYMGMIGTVMNALALQALFNKRNTKTVVLSSIAMNSVCETYSRDRASRYMDDGFIVIFAGGTGSPFVSTDTASVFRAVEMHCDAMFKATSVDGVYSADPKKDPTARKYKSITYDEVLAHGLSFMDLSSIYTAREQKLPIVVFSMLEQGSVHRVLSGQGNFTEVRC